MTGPVLAVRDLQVSFPGESGPVHAVRGVSFELAPGESLALVGESGAGKSATALALMGLHPATTTISGSVRLRGEELLGRDDRAWSAVRGGSLAMIGADPLSALTPVYSIGDQIAEAVRVHHPVSRAEASARAVDLLALVGMPAPARQARAFPHELSGGMRQRAMIAMAVANGPAVLIADEPTTALDVTVQAQVLDVLRRACRETGAALLLITHDFGVVAGLADRVSVMYAGRVVEQGQADQVFGTPRMPYTVGLLGSVPRLDPPAAALPTIPGRSASALDLARGCPFAPRCPLAAADCVAAEPALAATDQPGHLAACRRTDRIVAERLGPTDLFPPPPAAVPALAAPREERVTTLRIAGLKRHYAVLSGPLRRRVGTVYTVDGIDLEIRAGEALGLVGESGCGKTSTLLEVLGLRRPAAGTIEVLGHDLARLSAKGRRSVRRGLSVVFQDPVGSLDPRMTAYDLVAEPLRAFRVARRMLEPRVDELLRLVGLDPDHGDRFPDQFSSGQRQRIGIARALALQPRLLLLDEPVSALDVSVQAGVLNLLADLKTRLSLSYLLVSHDLAVVRQVADRVAVMHLGRIVESGPADQVYRSPAHPYTQALLSAVPLPDPVAERSRDRIVLSGELPSPADPPSGCRFRTRCQKFPSLSTSQQALCVGVVPLPRPVAVSDHFSACHYSDGILV